MDCGWFILFHGRDRGTSPLIRIRRGYGGTANGIPCGPLALSFRYGRYSGASRSSALHLVAARGGCRFRDALTVDQDVVHQALRCGLAHGAEPRPTREKGTRTAVNMAASLLGARAADEADCARHMDYIHFNPVKHGLVSSARQCRIPAFADTSS